MGHLERAGVTLIELMVVLTILSVLAAVTGLALRRAQPLGAVDARTAIIARARQLAVDSGRPVHTTVDVDSVPTPVTAYPDGSVIGDAALHIDRLSGSPDAP
jgi:prepilin-type N-terminal cleavage/methylation domain-containing protein